MDRHGVGRHQRVEFAEVELRTHCRLREITMNEHGMGAGVVYYGYCPKTLPCYSCSRLAFPPVEHEARGPSRSCNNSAVLNYVSREGHVQMLCSRPANTHTIAL